MNGQNRIPTPLIVVSRKGVLDAVLVVVGVS